MKNKKTMIMSSLAAILTAVIIYVSGGQVLIATLLGSAGIFTIPGAIYLKGKEKNTKTHIKEENSLKNYSQIFNNNQTPESSKEQIYIVNSDKKDNNDRATIAPIKQYDESIIPELITIDALSQKKSVLVRIRKKETKENLNQLN